MAWDTARPPRDARGYGRAHKARRNAELTKLSRAGSLPCVLGGEPLYAADINLPRSSPRKPVLDHCECRTGCGKCDGTGYRGLACWEHNARQGAKVGQSRRQAYGTVTTLRW